MQGSKKKFFLASKTEAQKTRQCRLRYPKFYQGVRRILSKIRSLMSSSRTCTFFVAGFLKQSREFMSAIQTILIKLEGFDNIQSRKVMIPVTELDGVPVVGMHELTHVFGTNAEFIVAVKKKYVESLKEYDCEAVCERFFKRKRYMTVEGFKFLCFVVHSYMLPDNRASRILAKRQAVGETLFGEEAYSQMSAQHALLEDAMSVGDHSLSKYVYTPIKEMNNEYIKPLNKKVVKRKSMEKRTYEQKAASEEKLKSQEQKMDNPSAVLMKGNRKFAKTKGVSSSEDKSSTDEEDINEQEPERKSVSKATEKKDSKKARSLVLLQKQLGSYNNPGAADPSTKTDRVIATTITTITTIAQSKPTKQAKTKRELLNKQEAAAIKKVAAAAKRGAAAKTAAAKKATKKATENAVKKRGRAEETEGGNEKKRQKMASFLATPPRRQEHSLSARTQKITNGSSSSSSSSSSLSGAVTPPHVVIMRDIRQLQVDGALSEDHARFLRVLLHRRDFSLFLIYNNYCNCRSERLRVLLDYLQEFQVMRS